MSRIRDRKKALILNAACAIFANHGYSGTKIIDIANKIDVPKANIYYYFENKEALYRSVLESFVTPLLQATAPFDDYRHPADALTNFIKLKIEISKNHPNASKVFANEILQGAPHLPQDIIDKLCFQTEGAQSQLQQWIDQGLMDDISPIHLLFTLWAATQTYADFNWQVKLHLKTDSISDQQFEDASNMLIKIILKGCGITPQVAK